MPATGWDGRFDNVDGALHLPPGHRLIAAIGADFAPGSWWESWGLWNVFGVLIIVVFVYWTAGVVPAAIAALALLLTYQEAPGYIWLWGNLLAALAIARAAPEGRFQTFARVYRTASFVVLGIALLPFLWMQVRVALYPQLEPACTAIRSRGTELGSPARTRNMPRADAVRPRQPLRHAADAAAPAMPAPMRGRHPAKSRNLSARAERPTFRRRRRKIERPQHGAGRAALRRGHGAAGRPRHSRLELQLVSLLLVGSGGSDGHGALHVRRARSRCSSGGCSASSRSRCCFVWLAVLSFGGSGRPAARRMPERADDAARIRGSAGWSHDRGCARSVLLVAAALGGSAPAQAQAPSSELLAELKTRLTAAPECAPNCAEVTAARVVVDGDRLEVTMQVSALAPIAVAMPHASDRWQLDEVSVDARGSLADRSRGRCLAVGAADGRRTHRAARGPARRRRVHPARLPADAAHDRRERARLDGQRSQRGPAGGRLARARARTQRAAIAARRSRRAASFRRSCASSACSISISTGRWTLT